MLRALAVLGCLLLSTVRALVVRTSPPPFTGARLCGRTGTNHGRCHAVMDGVSMTIFNEEGSGSSVSRRGWLQEAATSAAAIATASVAWQPGSTSAPGMPPPARAEGQQPQPGFFLQHAVINVADMEAEVRFYTEGLGMHVVRQRKVGKNENVFVSYGPETLAEGKGGGYFSLELVKDADEPLPYGGGGSFRYIGLTLPEKLAMVAYKVDEAGGSSVPHWFATKDFAEFVSPGGVNIRVKEGQRKDPFTVLAFASGDVDKAERYYQDALGMKEQSSGLLKLLGPLAAEANHLSGYSSQGVSVALLPEPIIREGGLLRKIAVLSRDTTAAAEAVKGSDGVGKVLFAGEMPGIGTKVANTVDFEGRGLVFVDYDDFEGELKPPSPAPTPLTSALESA